MGERNAEEKARCAARTKEREEGQAEKDESGKRARTAAEAGPGPGFLSEAFSRRSRESPIKISPEASNLGECSADRRIMWSGGVALRGVAWHGVAWRLGPRSGTL